MKKVLIITYYWPPSGGAGVQRWFKMSKYLTEFGIEPIIITVDPKFATYPVLDESFLEKSIDIEVHKTKSFEPLRIYEKMVGKSRVPFSGFANVSTETVLSKISRWLRGNLFIPDARQGWNRYALRMAVKVMARNQIDLVVTTGPPHSSHLIGLQIQKRFGLPWIADFRDPWTDIYYYDKLLHTNWAKQIDTELEAKVLRKADLILCACESNKFLLKKKLKGIGGKISVLTNGFDEEDFNLKRVVKADTVFTVVYTGTLADSYNVFPILTILSQLKIDWKLILAGSVTPNILTGISTMELKNNVVFRGRVSHSSVIELLLAADMLLHILPDIKEAEMGTTGKLFEYLGAKRPIINFGPIDGDAAQIIRSAGAGKSFNRTDLKGTLNFIMDVFGGGFSVGDDIHKFSRKSKAKQFSEMMNQFE